MEHVTDTTAANGGEQHAAGKLKEFGLSSFAIGHPTSVVVLTLILIVTGFVSYFRVPRESMPEIVIPNIIVTTVYVAWPPAVETLVTEPLEDELHTIADVKTISSTSREGVSSINVEFEAGMDMTEALQGIREKVDLAKAELPSAANDPQIFEINTSRFPIMQVNVAGPYNQVRLREVAEGLQERIEQIPSVLEAQLSGGLEREVHVDVDLAKLKFYGLTFNDVRDAVRSENVTVPGGSIEVGDLKYLVRVPGEFEAPAVIADIVIETREGRPIYVRDVARVDFGFKERDSFARLDGIPVISLAVVKRSGDNIIETAEAVRAVIAAARPSLPPGTVIKFTADQSNDIRTMVSNLENNIISGLLLVMGVLLFFLGVRTAPFVGLAIPLSMLISFVIMQLVGFTLNYGGAVQPDPGPRHAGGQRDRGGGEHLPLPRTRLRRRGRGPLRHRRGLGADHRLHRHHPGGVRAAGVLAGTGRRVHEVPAADPDHHPEFLAVRGADHPADPGGAPAGDRGRGAARGAAGGARAVPAGGGRGARRRAAGELAHRAAAGGHGRAGDRLLLSGGQARRALGDVPRPDVGRAPLRGGAALGAAAAGGDDGPGGTDVVVMPKSGAQIPLSSVARWHISRSLGDVTRKDLSRVVTISSDVRAEYNANAVVAEVKQALAPFTAALPAGYTLRFTGQQQEQQESQDFLFVAFVLAAFLIAFILISQFDSVTKPIIIISSVVLSTVGVLLGLTLFRMPFVVVMTGVGVISLAGVVVNNAIVLIDYVDLLRRRDGRGRDEAIVRGGVTRFRPVILTAITTILGLVPLAIGLNFDFFGLYTALESQPVMLSVGTSQRPYARLGP